MTKTKPNVYIINRASHDFSAAKQWGSLIYLSDTSMSRYATNKIYRQFVPILRVSQPDDYILITSLNIMNVIACSIFVMMHEKLNLLIHRAEDNSYVERRLDLSQLSEMNQQDLKDFIQA